MDDEYIFIFIIIIFIFLMTPFAVLAHGGVEKRTGNVLVTLFQTPLSPFEGEKIDFTFVLSNATTGSRLVYRKARLVVTETAYGDPSKDKILLTKEVKSDVNGVIEFSDTFYKTNYYDIDLEFGKPGDEENTTGFLVQPRSTVTSLAKILLISLLVSGAANVILSLAYIKKN